jgi:hypothetical protein
MEGPLSWLLDIFLRFVVPLLLLAYTYVRRQFQLPLIALPSWRGSVLFLGSLAMTLNFVLLWSYSPLLRLLGASPQTSESVHGVCFFIGMLCCLVTYLAALIGKGSGRIPLTIASTLAFWFWLKTISLRLF